MTGPTWTARLAAWQEALAQARWRAQLARRDPDRRAAMLQCQIAEAAIAMLSEVQP